jgi:hypothetical protein
MSQAILNALGHARRAHLANVLLVQTTPRKNLPEDADRAEKTVAQLQRQVAEIDDQIQRITGRAAK